MRLKPFIGDFAKRNGFNQSMAIDEYVTKTVNSIKPYMAAFYADESGH